MLQQYLQIAMWKISVVQLQLQSQCKENKMDLQALQDHMQTSEIQQMSLWDRSILLSWELQQQQSEKEVLKGQWDNLNTKLQKSIWASNHLLEQIEELRELRMIVQKRQRGMMSTQVSILVQKA